MTQKMVVTQRQCKARKVPSGELVIIPKDEFLTITQDLGGNYTVTWRGNMLRIDSTDADAIGKEALTLAFSQPKDNLINKDDVYKALATIYDPEIPIDLLSLGLIYNVDINQNKQAVNIDMTLTAPGCGMGPVLVSDVKYRLQMVPNVKEVNVNLVFDPPWSRDMMSEEAQLEAGLFF
jgi:probable FeS assembly SUF system protein SufT